MAVETMEFKTELRQLLHLITHSLYSNREIFLRELISNAADAINKIRFDSLADEARKEGDRDWRIRLIPDAEANTLTIADNGIGMSRDTIVDLLGTIAKSGTKAFLEAHASAAKGSKPDLIGQFGVGFYSAYMVADKVRVVSRPPGSPEDGVRWESDGQGTFTVEACEKPTRGTEITLYLKDDAKEFTNGWTLRTLVERYSNFIEHPIILVETKKPDEAAADSPPADPEENTLNSRTALWLKSKSEVTAEEYEKFYTQLSGDTEKPARIIHYTAEGVNEFRVLAFLPAKRPMDFMWSEPKGMSLYIQRVLIMESCEQLLPNHLRFVRGVVDSSDLPLNISREILQQNPVLEKIRKNLVRNVLESLEGMKNTEYDAYVSFFKEYGAYLKEGVTRDWSNRDRWTDLVLLQSTKTEPDKFTTLADYVGRCPADQENIYYLIGESREQLEHSPLLEAYHAKGWEVLLCTEAVDEITLPQLREYKGKKLLPIDREETAPPQTLDIPVDDVGYRDLMTYLKAKLPETADVRLTNRLRESASCLVADKNSLSANYERLMAKYGKLEEESKRVLELNGDHALVKALRSLHAKNAENPQVESLGRILYEQAVLAEGSKLKDPAGFNRRVLELLAQVVPAEG